MSSVSVPRRFALLLIVIAAALSSFTCTSYRYRKNIDVRCTAGNFSKNHPLICIDERNLTANPSHAVVHDIEGKNGAPTGRPVRIDWYAQRTSDLIVSMKTEGCVQRPVECDHLGHCWAITMKLPTDVKQKVCTYGMQIGDRSLDPDDDIVMTPCCY